MKRLVFFIFIFLFATVRGGTSETLHGVVFCNGKPSSLDSTKFHNLRSTEDCNIKKSSDDIKVKNISVSFRVLSDSDKKIKVWYHRYYYKTKKEENSKEVYNFKIINNIMYISDDNKDWDILNIEVRGLKRIKRFRNDKYMIIYLKSKYLEGEFAVIEN